MVSHEGASEYKFSVKDVVSSLEPIITQVLGYMRGRAEVLKEVSRLTPSQIIDLAK